jgi:hypothetical protein
LGWLGKHHNFQVWNQNVRCICPIQSMPMNSCSSHWVYPKTPLIIIKQVLLELIVLWASQASPYARLHLPNGRLINEIDLQNQKALPNFKIALLKPKFGTTLMGQAWSSPFTFSSFPYLKLDTFQPACHKGAK